MKRIVLATLILLGCLYSTAQVSKPADYIAIQGIKPGGDKPAQQAKSSFIIGINESLGGYVFYLTPDGKHGLVAATQDQSASSDWYSAQDAISNPENHNTDGKKFSDWRLPTRFELNLMYTQKSLIGGFSDIYYWSSILNGSKYAWMQNFGNGAQDYGSVDGTYHVRAVRPF